MRDRRRREAESNHHDLSSNRLGSLHCLSRLPAERPFHSLLTLIVRKIDKRLQSQSGLVVAQNLSV